MNREQPGERARRTAYASLKHPHEKVGDHWAPEHPEDLKKADLVKAIEKANARATAHARTKR